MDSFKNLTILYIENEYTCRKKNLLMMREAGFSVMEADDPIIANELCRKHKIDVILIDLNLHQADWMNFIRFLRLMDDWTPVIITAYDSNIEILLDAINLDTTRFLVKPLQKDELLNALKIAVHKVLPPRPAILVNNDLHDGFTYDPINKAILHPDGSAIHFSKKEYLLIDLLVKNKRKIVSFAEIESVVWEDNMVSIDAIRTLVRAIRKKTYPHIISNYSGIGYKIDI